MFHAIHKRVNIPLTSCVIAAVAVTGFAASASAVTIDWVTVGNAGNAADTTTYGAVSYEYRISKYEITNAQYTEFLNAVGENDDDSLYNTSMGSETSGGITRSGPAGSYTYSVKTNMGDKPVNYVSWFDAAMFCNWLSNGQISGGTGNGAYFIDGNNVVINRNLNNPNHVFLPTEDEWYKAAYHQPAAQGGDFDDYWLYPMASNGVPTVATANSTGDISNPGTNVVNYDSGANWNSGVDGNVTTVGSAGLGSESFYDTYDQGGNVWEWNETLIDSSNRGLRGGSYRNGEDRLQSSYRNDFNPTDEADHIGFRVASLVSIPEPASAALLALGAPLLLRRRSKAVTL